MLAKTKSRLDIRPLSNNTEELTDLISLSWPVEHSQHVVYSTAYLEYLLKDPQIIPELCVGLYVEDKLISFVLSKHKRISYKHKTVNVLFNTLATTHPDYAHLFPYLKLKNHCLNVAKKMGFQITSGYVISEVKNNFIETFFAEKNGLKCLVVAKYSSLFKRIGVKEGAIAGVAERAKDRESIKKDICCKDVSIRVFTQKDLWGCKEVLVSQLSVCDFYEVISEEELLYRLNNNDFTQTTVIEHQHRTGFVNLQITNLYDGRKKVKAAIIYGFFMESFSKDVVSHVLQTLFLDLSSQGVSSVLIPDMGYFDHRILHELGFRHLLFDSTKTNLYFTLLSDLTIDDINHKFYMEIV